MLCELYTWLNVYGKRETLGLENIPWGFGKRMNEMIRDVEFY